MIIRKYYDNKTYRLTESDKNALYIMTGKIKLHVNNRNIVDGVYKDTESEELLEIGGETKGRCIPNDSGGALVILTYLRGRDTKSVICCTKSGKIIPTDYDVYKACGYGDLLILTGIDHREMGFTYYNVVNSSGNLMFSEWLISLPSYIPNNMIGYYDFKDRCDKIMNSDGKIICGNVSDYKRGTGITEITNEKGQQNILLSNGKFLSEKWYSKIEWIKYQDPSDNATSIYCFMCSNHSSSETATVFVYNLNKESVSRVIKDVVYCRMNYLTMSQRFPEYHTIDGNCNALYGTKDMFPPDIHIDRILFTKFRTNDATYELQNYDFVVAKKDEKYYVADGTSGYMITKESIDEFKYLDTYNITRGIFLIKYSNGKFGILDPVDYRASGEVFRLKTISDLKVSEDGLLFFKLGKEQYAFFSCNDYFPANSVYKRDLHRYVINDDQGYFFYNRNITNEKNKEHYKNIFNIDDDYPIVCGFNDKYGIFDWKNNKLIVPCVYEDLNEEDSDNGRIFYGLSNGKWKEIFHGSNK